MIAKKLLELHMDRVNQENKIDEIVDSLNSKLYFHGHPINREEATQMGLKIKDCSKELEVAMWNLYTQYEIDMQLETQFNAMLELKRANLATVTNNQEPLIRINHPINDLVVSVVEGDTRTDELQADIEVEYIKTSSIVPGQMGFQEVSNLSQVREEWVSTVVALAPAPTQTRQREKSEALNATTTPVSAKSSSSSRKKYKKR
jgi:hypothetical protein